MVWESEDAMSEVWDPLKDEVMDTLEGGVSGLVGTLTPEIKKFLSEQAQKGAMWKWLSIHGGTAELRAEADVNLKHLRAQARGETARMLYSASDDVKKTVGSLLETVLFFLLKVSPKLLGI